MKFRCENCGECCRHIRGMIPAEDKEFLKEYAYGKMPLFQLQPVDKISFPLWSWEAKRFLGWQKDVNIEGKIKPSRAMFDLGTNKAIIVTYFFDSDSCPFLIDNKCAVYDKKRAYICRLFPFNKGPFIETDDHLKEDMFGSCIAMKEILKNCPDGKEDMVEFLNQVMPDELLNVVQHDIITEWVNKTIVALVKKKRIRPAMNYPYDFLMRRVSNSDKIDFTDFLVEIDYYTEYEINEMIQRFDNNFYAKNKIAEFLRKRKENFI